MTRFGIAAGLAALALASALASAPVKAAVPVYGATVVNTFPHDPEAFTEGRFWLDGFLYESTGLEGKSSLRKVEQEASASPYEWPVAALVPQAP